MFTTRQLVMVTEDGRHVRAVAPETGAPAWWLAVIGTSRPIGLDPWRPVFRANLPGTALVRAVVVTGRRAWLVCLTDTDLVVFDRDLTLVRTVPLSQFIPLTVRGRGIRVLPNGTIGVLASLRGPGARTGYVLIECSDTGDALIQIHPLPGVPLTDRVVVPFAVDGPRVVYLGLDTRGQVTLYNVPIRTAGDPAVISSPSLRAIQAIVTGPLGRILSRETQPKQPDEPKTPGEPLPPQKPSDAAVVRERGKDGKPTGRQFPTGSPTDSRLAPSLTGYWVVTQDAGPPRTLVMTEYDWDGAIRQRVVTPDFSA